ncbi:MAG: PIN domain-containing protein [Proteobacteria bacterium]|nr:PIN domain-containing protein [Pseudomonadota bacterium]
MRDRVLVDSNILVDVFADDPHWAGWSIDQLEKLSSDNNLIINPIVYCEVSIAFDRIEDFENAIEQAGFKMENIPKEALFLAGKVFLYYRRKSKSTKRSTLPNFFIGAHAAVAGIPLLTRDPKHYRTYFPKLSLVYPTRN